jgi:hypothetical protein
MYFRGEKTGSRWIRTTRMPRMTAANSQNPLGGPTHGTVFVDRLYEIIAARGFKSTMASDHRPNEQLVKTRADNQCEAGNSHNPA